MSEDMGMIMAASAATVTSTSQGQGRGRGVSLGLSTGMSGGGNGNDGQGPSARRELARHVTDLARRLVPASGWIFYRVRDGRIDDLLLVDERADRFDAYFQDFQQLDPLSPQACLPRDAVACLGQRLSPALAAHARYYSDFMQPYRLCDAVELYIPARSGECFGLSVLRDAGMPAFGAAEVASLAALQRLAALAADGLGAADILRPPATRASLRRRYPELTERELDVAHAVSRGMGNKEICREEGMALSTVKTHLQNIFRKTGLRSRTELAGGVKGRRGELGFPFSRE